jgi:hypothetical protein
MCNCDKMDRLVGCQDCLEVPELSTVQHSTQCCDKKIKICDPLEQGDTMKTADTDKHDQLNSKERVMVGEFECSRVHPNSEDENFPRLFRVRGLGNFRRGSEQLKNIPCSFYISMRRHEYEFDYDQAIPNFSNLTEECKRMVQVWLSSLSTDEEVRILKTELARFQIGDLSIDRLELPLIWDTNAVREIFGEVYPVIDMNHWFHIDFPFGCEMSLDIDHELHLGAIEPNLAE